MRNVPEGARGTDRTAVVRADARSFRMLMSWQKNREPGNSQSGIGNAQRMWFSNQSHYEKYSILHTAAARWVPPIKLRH